MSNERGWFHNLYAITFKTNLFIIMQEDKDIILDDPYLPYLLGQYICFANTVPLFHDT